MRNGPTETRGKGTNDRLRNDCEFGTVRDFDRIYADGDFHRMSDIVERHRSERRRFYELLTSNVGEGQGGDHPRVLEIGCGTAIDSLALAEATNCRAYGIDLSIEAIKTALQASSTFTVGIILAQADVHELPFKEETFDLVFSQGVLEHFSDPRSVIEEQRRVLRSGGRLVISVPQKYTAYTLAKRHRIRKGTWPWGYESEFSFRALRSLGDSLGLRMKAVIGYGYWLHPLEPMWLLRSLSQKLRKLPLLGTTRPARWTSQVYDRLWCSLESRVGHYFMRDIAIVFSAP